MLSPTELMERARRPLPRVVEFTGRGKTKFKNGCTWTLAGKVAGEGRAYSFFASRTFYFDHPLQEISVSLRTLSGKSVQQHHCQTWRGAVEADREVIIYFHEQVVSRGEAS